jgi:Domain of unknown function (DUF6285)
MTYDNPSLPEILRTVREFVDSVSPRLDGLDRYHALCTIYLLEIAERELNDWQPAPRADDLRLRNWLAMPESTQPAALVEELCMRIRAGTYDQDMDGLLALLTAHVRDKVAISKPSALDGASAD